MGYNYHRCPITDWVWAESDPAGWNDAFVDRVLVDMGLDPERADAMVDALAEDLDRQIRASSEKWGRMGEALVALGHTDRDSEISAECWSRTRPVFLPMPDNEL